MTESGVNASTITVETGVASLRVTLLGEGPTVVMFPSLGRDVEDFDELADALARAGYRTAAISPRGIGGSTGPLEGLTLRDLAGDVAAVIDALGAAPAHLIGHAFGNQVVRYTAAQFPDSVRSVTILAAGGKVMGEPEVSRAFADFRSGGLSDDEARAAIKKVHFAEASDPSPWLTGWWLEAAEAQTGAVLSGVLEEWWEAGRAPLLIIQGLEDAIAPVANGRDLAETLGDRAKLVELADAAHALLPEQPDAIAQEVIAFLATCA